ncbi:MAG TPA: hypothetical protein VN726_05485 [Hanamia sp.]|nr:hypothetical protein [Hanamia sp.]
MKTNLLLMLSFLMILFASCSKDHKDATSSAIQGTYKLKYITVKDNSTLSALNQKSVNVVNYTTTNNGGTFVIDASNITTSGLTWEATDSVPTYTYYNNQLVDSTKSSFTIKYPATNSSTSYKLIGTDSIYLPQGGPASVILSGTGLPAGSYGGRYNLSGNVLTIIQSASKDSTFQSNGLSYTLSATEIASVVMEKQ